MNRALILGGRGFVGTAVAESLQGDYDIFTTCLEQPEAKQELQVDLTQRQQVKMALRTIKPSVIVNCAGVVSNDEKSRINIQITQNLQQSVIEAGIDLERIIILGSAAEYGVIDKRTDFPIGEDYHISPTSVYGQSKAEEISLAIVYAKKHNLPLTVARLFNPIGPGMNERMLIPSLLSQLREANDAPGSSISVNRLDAERDFIDVRDVAAAISLILRGEPGFDVYNIGSGIATSIKRLVEIMLEKLDLTGKVVINESSEHPEQTVASQADIARISREFGWRPEHTLENVISELIRE